MSETYSRDIAYSYAEGTANAWEQKMRQEDEDTLRDEEANPNIYRPEDGHAFVESTWDSVVGCILCSGRKFQHTQQEGKS